MFVNELNLKMKFEWIDFCNRACVALVYPDSRFGPAQSMVSALPDATGHRRCVDAGDCVRAWHAAAQRLVASASARCQHRADLAGLAIGEHPSGGAVRSSSALH